MFYNELMIYFNSMFLGHLGTKCCVAVLLSSKNLPFLCGTVHGYTTAHCDALCLRQSLGKSSEPNSHGDIC